MMCDEAKNKPMTFKDLQKANVSCKFAILIFIKIMCHETLVSYVDNDYNCFNDKNCAVKWRDFDWIMLTASTSQLSRFCIVS